MKLVFSNLLFTSLKLISVISLLLVLVALVLRDYRKSLVITEETLAETHNEESPYYDYGKGSIIGETFRGLPKPTLPADKPYFGESIDIDNDGCKEIVFYTLVAMTKSPHRAYIVKDNKIIFESDTRQKIHLRETEDKNGFYLEEYTIENTKNGLIETTKYTKYRYTDHLFVQTN